MEDVTRPTEKGDFDYVRSVEGGLDAPFMAIYIPSSYQVTGGAKALADSLIDLVETLVEKNPEKFALARSVDEIRINFKVRKISLPLGMENGAPIGDDLENLRYFYDRGIRYITLTHGKVNQICDSSYDTTRIWNGLSPFGVQVVAEMNRLGIMVDVSHISDSAFYQVLEVSKAPVIASHSSCRAFTPGFERNMSDQMIQLLAAKGGVIQLNFGSTFISRRSYERSQANREHIENWRLAHDLSEEDSVFQEYARQYTSEHRLFTTVTRVADQIDHIVSLVGVDHVAFGSDFEGLGDSLPEGLKDVSHYPNLLYQLLKRGYSDGDIEKICSGNLFRVWTQVSRTASELQAAS